MELNAYLVVGSTIIMIVLIWIVVGYRHLSAKKIFLGEMWEMIDELLRKRQSLVPILIEIYRSGGGTDMELVQKLIDARIKAAKKYESDADKITYEYDVTRLVNAIMEESGKQAEIAENKLLPELKEEFEVLEKDADLKSREYNQFVRGFNNNLKNVVLFPVGKVFGFKKVNIFEMEV